MTASIEAGSSISHYRIVSSIGSGGMGEVYMAHDTTLERMVALKVLPAELTQSAERVRRFIDEARSASSLSHPYIVTIHEIGQAEVRPPQEAEEKTDSDPIHYIAMELIDGHTLKQKIHREKDDLKKLLVYLTQAAEGLSKAHAAGIVHRDLKPENIMITKDGFAKVLDFGLAKLAQRAAMPGETNAATALKEQTREGVIMGTIGYMSPEQVQGKVADQRTDIFSFGCILYEAATRQKPFHASSDVDVLHQILHDKPRPIEELNPEVPAELRRIIRRCLAKEPDKRYQSMKDLALELGEVAEEYDELSRAGSRASDSGISAPSTAISSKRKRLLTTAIAAGAIIIIAGAALALWQIISNRSTTARNTFASMKIARLTTSGKVSIAGISPDGRYVAHAIFDKGKNALWVRQVATGSDVLVVAPAVMGFGGVTFSADGNYLYYSQRESEQSPYSVLYQVPSLGGTPRKLLFDIDTPVTLSPDGRKMAFVRGYPHLHESVVVIVNADGTGEQKLAVRKGADEFPLIQASWSPDGKTIAAIAGNTGQSIIVAIDTESGKQQPVGDKMWGDVSGVSWLPDKTGILLTAAEKEGNTAHQIWLLTYPDGALQKVTNDLNDYFGISTTADGKTIATIQSTAYANVWALPADDMASARQLTTGNQEAIQWAQWGAGGSIVLAANANGTSDLFVIEADGSRRRLTSKPGEHRGPSVSADGRRILFVSTRGGAPHIWKIEPDGSSPVQLTSGKGEINPRISPDGRWFLYRAFDGGLWKMEVTGGKPARIAPSTTDRADISRDGNYIVFPLYRAGANRVNSFTEVIPSSGGAVVSSFEREGVNNPRFSPDGKAIDYVFLVDGVGNVWRQPLDSSPAIQLTRFKEDAITSFDWSQDGKTLLLTRGNLIRDVVLISDYR